MKKFGNGVLTKYLGYIDRIWESGSALQVTLNMLIVGVMTGIFISLAIYMAIPIKSFCNSKDVYPNQSIVAPTILSEMESRY